jgi:molybdopterin synthase sulfur carrier subunit
MARGYPAPMARVSFTSHLGRHLACPTELVPGGTVREVLDGYFARHPGVRPYVLDEQSVVRRHVVIFIDGEQATDRDALSDRVKDGAEIFVMQALSGG